MVATDTLSNRKIRVPSFKTKASLPYTLIPNLIFPIKIPKYLDVFMNLRRLKTLSWT